jgi:hypothetical protein
MEFIVTIIRFMEFTPEGFLSWYFGYVAGQPHYKGIS